MFGDDIFRGGPSKVEVFTASTNLHVWTKPTWATFVTVWVMGGGGGGGGGFTRAAGVQGGGGGGGGAASATMSIFIADLLPDIVYIRVGYGGDGGAADSAGSAGRFSGLLTRPTTTGATDIGLVVPGGGGGGGAGTGAAGGSGGSTAGGSIASNYVIGCTALTSLFQGVDSAGAGHASGTPTSANNTYSGGESPAKAGRGGAGITTGNVEGVGGARTAAYTPSVAVPGGAAGGGNGLDAYLATELNDAWKYMRYLTWGSSGGGANASGTGGKGGDGVLGAGGSGGGAGLTGGAGGRGGDGLVVIVSW